MTQEETTALLSKLKGTPTDKILYLHKVPSVYDYSTASLDLGKDFDSCWEDASFAKFPCSHRNTYRLKTDPSNHLSKWKLICESISSPNETSGDLVNSILSYSPTFINDWTFGSLHQFCKQLPNDTNFWTQTLPFIAELAQRLPTVFACPVKLLSRQVPAECTLSQEQCAVIVANMFFCTFPQRSTVDAHGGTGSGAYENFPSVNFNTLFADHTNPTRANTKIEKLKCIIHYFETLRTTGIPQGKVTWRRQVLDDGHQIPWQISPTKLIMPDIYIDGTIEDNGVGCWQVDFANKIIGGGVIGAGCVQEEIRFVINPECLVSRLLCEILDHNESILIFGPQRFSNYSGYRDTFAFSGPHEDKLSRDGLQRIQTTITAIDAVHFHHRSVHQQFHSNFVHRELNKAYIGFMPNEGDSDLTSPIATGHWGCGAFNGDKCLKAFIQWIAASEAGRKLKYFAFKDADFADKFKTVCHSAIDSEFSIADLMLIISTYNPRSKISLFDYFMYYTSGGRPSM